MKRHFITLHKKFSGYRVIIPVDTIVIINEFETKTEIALKTKESFEVITVTVKETIEEIERRLRASEM